MRFLYPFCDHHRRELGPRPLPAGLGRDYHANVQYDWGIEVEERFRLEDLIKCLLPKRTLRNAGGSK